MKLDLIRQQQIFREGVFYVGGRLYLFEKEQVLVLEDWPKLRAWRRLADSTRFERIDPPVVIHGWNSNSISWQRGWRLPGWLVCEPFSTNSVRFRHGSEYDEPNKCQYLDSSGTRFYSDYPQEILDHERYHGFIDSIPQAVLSRITRFTYGQWRLAVMCSRIPAFVELIDSHPALAFALVHAERFRDQPMPSLASLRNKIRFAPEKLAAWLGFPESPATVEILQLILPSACHVEWLLKLRQQYFAQPKPVLLRRLVLIDHLTLALLVAWPTGSRRGYCEMVTGEFIIEFAALEKDARDATFAKLWAHYNSDREFSSISELEDRKFSSSAEREDNEFEQTAYSLLDECEEDWGDKHLALYLPEPPDFLTLLNASDAPTWPFVRRYQFVDSENVLVVRAERVDFEGGRNKEFKDLIKDHRDALVDWLKAALRRMAQEKTTGVNDPTL